MNHWHGSRMLRAALLVGVLLGRARGQAGSVDSVIDASFPTQWSQPQMLPGGRLVPSVPTGFETRSVGVAFQPTVAAAGVSAGRSVTTNSPALLAAAEVGDTNTIKVLLTQRVNVDTPNRIGATPLIVAASHGYAVTVRLLLDHKADINAVTREGRTALIYAVRNGHLKVVQLLLEANADPKVIDEAGKMAVDYAVAGKVPDLLALFKGPPAKEPGPAPR